MVVLKIVSVAGPRSGAVAVAFPQLRPPRTTRWVLLVEREREIIDTVVDQDPESPQWTLRVRPGQQDCFSTWMSWSVAILYHQPALPFQSSSHQNPGKVQVDSVPLALHLT